MSQAADNVDVGPAERMASDAYFPRKRADVLALDMGDGVILYNHDSSLVHHLSPSASVVWQLCDGDVDGEQLGSEIAEEYGLDRDEVVKQVHDVIEELDALGLIEDASGPSGADAPSGHAV